MPRSVLVLIAVWLRRIQIPVAGFPVIVAATPVVGADAIADNEIAQE